jgi:hypothetical protein
MERGWHCQCLGGTGGGGGVEIDVDVDIEVVVRDILGSS